MKRLIFTCTILIFSILTVSGQKKGKTTIPKFDIQNFNEKVALAEWLYSYDAVAWWTSDSVMVQDTNEIKRLGREWFCFQSPDKNWHAVYGKYENGAFDLVFHYIVDTSFSVSRVYTLVDTSILHPYSRALITANKQMQAIQDSIPINFNQYIRKNSDGTFSVYIFPAFQPNDYAVHGGEFIYTIDETGNKLLQDNSYYQGNFKAFKVDKPREIWLDYSELEMPNLETVFFAWYYKRYFTRIMIETKYFTTSTYKTDDGYVWIHVTKDDNDGKKDKKEKKAKKKK